MADEYKENGATSIISMLGSIVTALGFEITDNAKAAVTMLKMQKEILENASLRDFFTGNVSIKTIQNVSTGVWYVPGKLIHFVQQYLASDAGGGYPSADYKSSYPFVERELLTYSVTGHEGLLYNTPYNDVNDIVKHYNITGPFVYGQTNPFGGKLDHAVFVQLLDTSKSDNMTLYGGGVTQDRVPYAVLDNLKVIGKSYWKKTNTDGTVSYYDGEPVTGFPTTSIIGKLTSLVNRVMSVDCVMTAGKIEQRFYVGHNIGSYNYVKGGGITRGGGVGRRHSLPKEESFPPCGGETTVPEITEWTNRVINWNGECYMPLTYYKVNPSNENPGTEPGSPNTPINPDDPNVDPENIIKYIYPNTAPQGTPQNGENTDQSTGQLKDNYTNVTNGPSDIPSTDIKGGLYTLWHPSADNLQNLGAFLYGATNQGTIASIIGDPINAIIQLTEWAVKPVDGPVKTPVICNIAATDLKMPTIPNQFMQFDCGTIEIPREYHDFRDYEPYTRLSLFLPFVGDVNISTNDCITPHKIHVIYNIDFLSGVACAEVLVDEDVRYAYQAAMCAAIPVTSGDASRLLASLIGAAVGAVGGGVMGGIVGGTAGSRLAARSLISGVSEAALAPINGIQTQRTGSISANTGLLGEMKPYVLVTRPISVVSDQYKSLLGQPYQLDGTLGSQTGFVKVREVHLDGITATESEKQEIERLLKEGVIL